MKILALGGGGKICREAVFDLVQFGSFDKITIADFNLDAAKFVKEQCANSRVDSCFIDIRNKEESIKLMQGYDLVMDGTTISLNEISTECIAKAGCHGINLNGFGEEYKFDSIFKSFNKIFIPGFGMTPGTTNMMVAFATRQMEKVNTVRVSHGAFRPVAFSESIAETTVYEYDPKLPGRVVFEDGEFIQVPPFARPRDIKLPEPYGTHTQYIIPHSETVTLSSFLKNKGVQLIEVRGTWPPENMQLIKTLNDWGFLMNPKIEVNNKKIGIMDLVAKYLVESEKGTKTNLYGYALHVEITGKEDGLDIIKTLTHTHPSSDGSIPDWKGLRAYTRNVGIPMSIAVTAIANNHYKGTGVISPENALLPEYIFNELEKRKIFIHEKIHALNEIR